MECVGGLSRFFLGDKRGGGVVCGFITPFDCVSSGSRGFYWEIDVFQGFWIIQEFGVNRELYVYCAYIYELLIFNPVQIQDSHDFGIFYFICVLFVI